MKSLVFYFQVHQPRRIRPYRRSEIGVKHDYFWDERNMEIMQRVAQKCYLPTTRILLQEGIPASFSLSGVFLEQAAEYVPEVIDVFREYFRSGLGEIMSETYYHSLASVWNPQEFREQVEEHRRLVQRLFGVNPVSFRNTELIYSDGISHEVRNMGFRNMITEGTDEIIAAHSPNFAYRTVSGLKLLLRNYRMSDDIAFRFSNPGWNDFPLFADKYAGWVAASPGDVTNVFMDYETFGEHQWKETGICQFLKTLPRELSSRGVEITTVDRAASENSDHGTVSVENPISWADTDRNLNAWLGNAMQNDAFNAMKTIDGDTDRKTWRLLQTSDHIYYMSVRNFADQDVHSYFNPYLSPYLAFIYYMAILDDLKKGRV